MPDRVVGEIASAIHVRHIHTPIAAAEPFTRASRAADVAAHMEQHKYDVTPIFPGPNDQARRRSGDPEGTLRKVDLQSLDPADEVASVVRPLTGSTLIDSNATLVTLLDRFREEHRFMLVVGGLGLEGIVTPFDMNKQAGRTHLFMQISALEIALSDRLRAADTSDEEILGLLPDGRAAQVRRRWTRKQERDEATDIIAALDFQDLVNIQRFHSGIDAFATLSDDHVAALTRFRNSVMHAVLEPAGDDIERLEPLLTQTALVTNMLDWLQATS